MLTVLIVLVILVPVGLLIAVTGAMMMDATDASVPMMLGGLGMAGFSGLGALVALGYVLGERF